MSGFAASGYGIMWNDALREGQQAADAQGMAGPRPGALLRSRLDLGAVALGHDAPHHRDDPAGRRLGQRLAHDQGDRRQPAPGDRPLVRRARGREFGPGRLRHRHRLLRLLLAGRGLSGEVRLSVGDDAGAGQYRRCRQCAQQGRAPRPSSSSCSRRPARRRCSSPPSAACRCGPATYAKAPADYPNPFKDKNLQGLLTFNAELSEKRNDGRRRAVRPAHHLPARAAEGRHQGAARGRCGAGQEGQRPGPRPRQGSARPDRGDADHRRRRPPRPRSAPPSPAARRRRARQAELEQQWAAFAKEKYAAAKAKADEALKLVR